MIVVIREGVRDVLAYLNQFCEFYVYSHGLKSYVLKILQILDPDEKLFKERAKTVLAPNDQMEQTQFAKAGKSIKDFKDPLTKEQLFSADD
jgi:hypothetical protein